jgi:hypothetical protein
VRPEEGESRTLLAGLELGTHELNKADSRLAEVGLIHGTRNDSEIR